MILSKSQAPLRNVASMHPLDRARKIQVVGKKVLELMIRVISRARTMSKAVVFRSPTIG